MPTPSFLVVMLELGRIDGAPLTNPPPWGWTEWIEFTQRDHPPYVPHATPQSTGLPASELEAVKAFAQAYNAISNQAARMNYGSKPKANDALGRQVLQTWFRKQSELWGLNEVIHRAMADHGRDMYSLAAEDGDQVSVHSV